MATPGRLVERAQHLVDLDRLGLRMRDRDRRALGEALDGGAAVDLQVLEPERRAGADDQRGVDRERVDVAVELQVEAGADVAVLVLLRARSPRPRRRARRRSGPRCRARAGWRSAPRPRSGRWARTAARCWRCRRGRPRGSRPSRSARRPSSGSPSERVAPRLTACPPCARVRRSGSRGALRARARLRPRLPGQDRAHPAPDPGRTARPRSPAGRARRRAPAPALGGCRLGIGVEGARRGVLSPCRCLGRLVAAALGSGAVPARAAATRPGTRRRGGEIRRAARLRDRAVVEAVLTAGPARVGSGRTGRTRSPSRRGRRASSGIA